MIKFLSVIAASISALAACAPRPTPQVGKPQSTVPAGPAETAYSQNLVYAWGNNGGGQVGDGSTDHRKSPTPVTMLNGLGVIAVAAGGQNSMALLADGTVYVWGFNANAELGDGTRTTRLTPVALSLNGVSHISSGAAHSVVRLANGAAMAWGSNTLGPVGDNSTTDRLSPVQVTPQDTNFATVTTGTSSSYAVMADGTLRAWGNNISGQIGDGTNTQSNVPVTIGAGGPTNVTQISGGESHVLAIQADGTLWGWGSRAEGCLGDGASTGRRNSPTLITSIAGVRSIAAGYQHSVVVRDDGTVWTFGSNSRGQLGDGTVETRTSPVMVPGLSNIVAVEASYASSYALTADGQLWAWGSNSHGQLGIGADGDVTAFLRSPVVVPAPDGMRFLRISAGESSHHVLAIVAPPRPLPTHPTVPPLPTAPTPSSPTPPHTPPTVPPLPTAPAPSTPTKPQAPATALPRATAPTAAGTTSPP